MSLLVKMRECLWSKNFKNITKILVIDAIVDYLLIMSDLKTLDDLPEAQQKALAVILRIKKPAFRTSELIDKMEGSVSGRSVGGVVGSLFRNGYLQRLQGSRDKMWKLSAEADKSRDMIREQLSEVKQYWS